MAELRKVKIDEINDTFGKSDIPSNWYVPANQTWKYLTWCLAQLRYGNTFRNDKDLLNCTEQFFDWIEDYAIAFGEEHDDGTSES